MLQAVPAADSAAEIAAWWRLVELCLPSHEECGALTFATSGAETLEADWQRWVTGVFLPVLHPALIALQNAAAAQDSVRLLAGDAALGAALSHEDARRNRAAGRHLLLPYATPQVAKLLAWVDRAGAPSYRDLGAAAARAHYVSVAGTLDIAPTPMHAVDDLAVQLAGRTLRVRHYVPREHGWADPMPALLYFHGGGFTIGSFDTHDRICRMLAREADWNDWRFAPLSHPDLRGVAPAWIAIADHDPLRDDDRAYAARLREAGVAVDAVEYPGMIHAFFQHGGFLPTARRAHADAATALRTAFTGP